MRLSPYCALRASRSLAMPTPKPFTSPHPRRGHRRPARAPGAHALARRAAAGALVDRHQRGLREEHLRILAHGLRLASVGGQAQRLQAIHGADRRHRPALHPRAVPQGRRHAAADLARLAGLGVRVPQDHAAADRALHGDRAVAAGLHAVVQARAAALRRDRDRRPLCRADDRRAGI